ncbi:MAG: hypothetical protein COT15_04885 [Candidatus Diapherotrites archaeon CG08_land_8_20_14_0_20_34_12]|nr:MAG: hypothetical protein COT15_04885 [Candidatus Diapherotrites archaeon CG08_land_8_20_14_0_20_34_12]
MGIGGFKVGPWSVREEAEKRYLIFDCRNCIYSRSISDDKACRYHVLKVLSEVQADLIVLAEVYERIYNEEQTKMLAEISALAQKFSLESVWSYSNLGDTTNKADEENFPLRYKQVVKCAQELIWYDPIDAYLTCVQEVRREEQRYEKSTEAYKKGSAIYLKTLNYIRSGFEKTILIKRAKNFLLKLKEFPETEDIYRAYFVAEIKPSFIGARLMFEESEELELLDEYLVNKTPIQIFKHPDLTQNLYFVNPPEYSLTPEKYFVLSKTKEIVAGYEPGKASLSTIARNRDYFERVYQSTIYDIAEQNKIKLSKEEVTELAEIVARYSVGYGILETILSDRRVTDVYVDAPIGQNPIYLVHSDYGQCRTNILYTDREAQAIVTKMRAMSARPFDEAHPVLDYDLPNLDTRVAVIGPPLSPDGIAFAFRLHKLTPWTLSQFLDVKFLNTTAAGMLSFFIDNQSTILIAGSRGSGKTSLMSAALLEILKSARILVQEDSVTGDSQILVEKGGELKQTAVGELIDGLIEKYGSLNENGRDLLCANPESIRVFSLNAENKIELSPVSQFMRHKVSKDIYEVETRSGRKIKVTKDHSLFTLKENEIVPVKTDELKQGSYIAVPRILPIESKVISGINVLEYLNRINDGFICGKLLGNFIENNFSKIKEMSSRKGCSKSFVSACKRKQTLPISIFKQLDYSALNPKELYFKVDKRSKPIPVSIQMNNNFLNIVGLWLADGSYDSKYAFIISTPDCGNEIKEFANAFGLNARKHSDGFSYIISNTSLVFLMREIMELKGNAYTKKFPDWAFRLSKQQINSIIMGLFSGDGCVGKYEVLLSSASEEMTKELHSLLLFSGIVARTRFVKKDKTYCTRVSSIKMVKAYCENIGFLQERKNILLGKLCERVSTHDVADIIPFSVEGKQMLAESLANFNSNDYIKKGYSVGREKLKCYLKQEQQSALFEKFRKLADSDVYWDEIRSIRNLGKLGGYVYDFSVPGNENFICENIIAHNTLELPIPYMKKIGFNVQRLKTRSAISVAKSETEIAPEEALRTALRLGDSAIILGEVRSLETKTLYEAMRIGAAGNVVMGTIHADSAYSVWDRVVNDLEVPTTSFKATDLVVVARPIRFSGSLKSARRVTQMTEVKKHWTTDPEAEGGLLDLMLYDAKKDDLELLEDNLKESDLFEKIRKTSGLTIEDMWKEIRVRGESKGFLVELKNKYKVPDLLEANYTTMASDKLLIIKERYLEEHGKPDYDAILGKWKNWAKEHLLKRVLVDTKKAQ